MLVAVISAEPGFRVMVREIACFVRESCGAIGEAMQHLRRRGDRSVFPVDQTRGRGCSYVHLLFVSCRYPDRWSCSGHWIDWNRYVDP